jgi:RHS repeat-associated protein
LTVDGPRTDVNDITTYSYYFGGYNSLTDTAGSGALALVTDALGHKTKIAAYDGNGRPLTVIDPNGITLTFTYYPPGWLKTSCVAGETTTYQYDNVGQLTTVTRPDASQTTYAYDAAHRLTDIGDTAMNNVHFTLDNAGNVTQTTWSNPSGTTAKQTSGDYDPLGRLYHAIAVRNAVSYSTTLAYDANGNRTGVTDPKGKATSFQYDALNRPTQITDALAGLTTLAYDARDQLTSLKTPNGAQTSFTVDGLGNVTQETSADRGNLTNTFDAAGNLLTSTDARGGVKTFTYDTLNRPLTASYQLSGQSTLTVAYTWDTASGCTYGVGHLCQVTDNAGSTSYAYDTHGNAVSKTRSEAGGTFTTTFSYDSADRPATVVTPTSKTISLDRNANGQVQQVATAVGSNPQVNLVGNLVIDAAGHTIAQSFGNGVAEAKTFNTDGSAAGQTETSSGSSSGDADVPTLPQWAAMILGTLLLGIVYRNQGRRNRNRFLGLLLAATMLSPLLAPRAFADELLTYDPNGNVLTRALSGGTTTYGYDALNRVKSEAGPAKTQTLGYDANDNRTSDGSGSDTYTANTDRLATINGQAVTLDAAGNVTSARGLTFVWNAAGQLASVSQGTTLLATYYYDFEGHRSRKVTTAAAPQGAGTVIYHYDLQGRLIAETTPANNPIATYVWRDDVPVSIILPGPPETALYLEVDHLNTPIAARNQAGQVVWRWESDAFGTTPPNEDPGGTGTKTTINLRFPGQYYDRESGLHYNWNRHYDPKLGRYTSPDPIGLAGGNNLYSYTTANPLRYIDWLGLETTITFIENGTKNSSTPFNALVEVDVDGTVTRYQGNTWPDRNEASPGIESGDYQGTYGATAHKGKKGIVLNNNNQINTVGPNPNHNGQSYADYVHVHAGGETTQRGSAGCLTIKKSQSSDFFDAIDQGGDTDVTVRVIRRDFN